MVASKLIKSLELYHTMIHFLIIQIILRACIRYGMIGINEAGLVASWLVTCMFNKYERRQEILLDLADFSLQEQPEDNLMVASHAVVFRGLVLLPPLKTTSWEANLRVAI